MASGRYEITKNELGEYRFALVTVSGRVLAHSGLYKTLGVCKKGIASLRVNADVPLDDRSDAENSLSGSEIRCPKIELTGDSFGGGGGIGGYNFAVRAKNGTVIATGEGYGTKKRCLEAIANLRYIAFSAETTEKNF